MIELGHAGSAAKDAEAGCKDELTQALERLRAAEADRFDWPSFRDLVGFDPSVDGPDAVSATALTDDEARALFRQCCGAEDGVARKEFLRLMDTHGDKLAA